MSYGFFSNLAYSMNYRTLKVLQLCCPFNIISRRKSLMTKFQAENHYYTLFESVFDFGLNYHLLMVFFRWKFYLLAWAVPTAIDISWVITWPHDIVTRVHKGSGIGKSGNITILTRRANGRGSWLATEVGGAWTPNQNIISIMMVYILSVCKTNKLKSNRII